MSHDFENNYVERERFNALRYAEVEKQMKVREEVVRKFNFDAGRRYEQLKGEARDAQVKKNEEESDVILHSIEAKMIELKDLITQLRFKKGAVLLLVLKEEAKRK